MAPLSKLTLTKFERSQTHQDPELDRRAKALNALAQKRDVLNAALEGWGRKLYGGMQRSQLTRLKEL